MKTRLLKKVRKKVKLYKRNDIYIIKAPDLELQVSQYELAIKRYQWRVMYLAIDIFGIKPKNVLDENRRSNR